MITRTTISFDQNYLDLLKLVSLKTQKSLSQIVSEAVRSYLSAVNLTKDNSLFFNELVSLKKRLKLDKISLINNIKKGRQ